MRARFSGRRAPSRPPRRRKRSRIAPLALVGAPTPVKAASLAPAPRSQARTRPDGRRGRAARAAAPSMPLPAVAQDGARPSNWLKCAAANDGPPFAKMAVFAAAPMPPSRAPAPPRLWSRLHNRGRQGPRGNDCASWGNARRPAEIARAPELFRPNPNFPLTRGGEVRNIHLRAKREREAHGGRKAPPGTLRTGYCGWNFTKPDRASGELPPKQSYGP